MKDACGADLSEYLERLRGNIVERRQLNEQVLAAAEVEWHKERVSRLGEALDQPMPADTARRLGS